MGNCISKISNDRLLAVEEFMKNKLPLKKERRGVALTFLLGEHIRGSIP